MITDRDVQKLCREFIEAHSLYATVVGDELLVEQIGLLPSLVIEARGDDLIEPMAIFDHPAEGLDFDS